MPCGPAAGIYCTDTGDGKQAGGEKAFHVALVDFQLPGMDGGEVARAIKSDPPLRDTKIILVTSAPQRRDAARMLDLGVSAYLTKPVRYSQHQKALAAVMDAGGKAGAADAMRRAPTP